MGLQEVRPEGCLQVWTVPPLHANQGEGHPGDGEEVQGGIPNPLQLWQEVHWGDSEEARDEDEGGPGCMPEGGTGEVGPCRACIGEPPPNQVGGGHGD